MLLTFNETSKLIEEGKLLHIAGTEELLKKLPAGNWIGGSTEYFMTANGGTVTGDYLFVNVFPYTDYKINSYDKESIANVTADAFDNGFSIIIVPFDSSVHNIYAQKAAEFKDMFIKNIVGWVSGVNLNIPEQIPITVNGRTGEVYTDKAVVMHICVSADKTVNVGIINIFSPDENSPVIEFIDEGFSVTKCKVDGNDVILADYITQNNIDTKLPLIGEYSGVGVNISFKTIENGKVNFYAPVFSGIKYKIAKPISDYVKDFDNQLIQFKGVTAEFSCNCILNFLYGEFEGKDIETFFGPITFGEIAYQLVNQTLVYVTIL